jgi:hypothetical protein
MLIALGVALAGFLAAQEPTAGPAPAASGEARVAAPAAAMRWTDPDGKPLPFRSEDELLEFLRTAEVKSAKRLAGGSTGPRKLLLEKDGIRADAVFRDMDVKRAPSSVGGRNALFFRDSYLGEPAAYQLSLLLGLDNVPPATLRELHGESGNVQIWVANAMTELKRVEDKIEPPDMKRWNKQLQMMNVFNDLVFNIDFNRGNILIMPDWKLFFIDYSRAFLRNPDLPHPGTPNQCERSLYERLKALDEGVVRERLKPYLSTPELDALMNRRKLIVERLDKLIAERGENAILYIYTDENAPAAAENPK